MAIYPLYLNFIFVTEIVNRRIVITEQVEEITFELKIVLSRCQTYLNLRQF